MVGLDWDDPPNEKNYLRFLGFIPGASYVFESATEKSNISGYDLGWYLAAQCIPSDLTVTAVDTNPADTLKSILGGADSLKTTGLDLVSGTITTVSGWDSIKKVFQWKFDTKKRKAVDELVDYCNYIFLIKFKQVGSGYYPIVYFVPYSNIDTGLDLPAIATFTNPDPYIIDIRQEIDESEKINRVVVHGTNRETGLWKTATEEAAEVTAGDVLPRELVVPDYTPEPPPADAAALQTAVDNKASELYTLFYTNAATTTIRVQLRRRADLELWQKVGFVNYDSIPAYSAPDTNVFRIIDIQYSRDVGKDTVEIECVPDKDLSTLLARRQVLGMDIVSSEQAIMEDMLQGMPENQIGTVTAISGNVAAVQLESSGKTVEARILNP